jgi:hypothetical protein
LCLSDRRRRKSRNEAWVDGVGSLFPVDRFRFKTSWWLGAGLKKTPDPFAHPIDGGLQKHIAVAGPRGKTDDGDHRSGTEGTEPSQLWKTERTRSFSNNLGRVE